MMCAPEWKVGLLGSSLFIGWCATLLWLPRLADVYGRKRLFCLGTFLDLVLYTALMLTRNLDVMIGIIFTVGLFTSLRVNVGFVLLTELMPKSKQTFVGTAWGVLESSIVLCSTFYFLFS